MAQSQTTILNCPILGLDDEFPDTLYILKHTPTGRYGCYNFDSIHGLASFSTKNDAFCFAEQIALSDMICEEVSFDEAREIAKSRPLPITSLMLLDDWDNPKIHYVK